MARWADRHRGRPPHHAGPRRSPEEGRHLIGLEFMNVSPSAYADIERVVTGAAAAEPQPADRAASQT